MTESLIIGSEDGARPLHVLSEQSFSDWLDSNPSNSLRAWAKASNFHARMNQVLLVPNTEGELDAVFVGCGTEPDIWDLATLADDIPPGHYQLFDHRNPSPMQQEQLALGWALGGYSFNRFTGEGDGGASKKQTDHVLAFQADINETRLNALHEGVSLARDLINTPANHMGPEELEAKVREVAEANGATVKSIIGDDLLKENYPLIHAVGAAGRQAPRLIDLHWGKETDPKLTIVGKGVCFDTGGLNIKPAAPMLLMKKDMGGAANALGLAMMVMQLKLRVRLRLLIPAVENSISSLSMRPSDILDSRKGLTVEVTNTDAEGRLVLADALTEADSESPDLLVDLATLTGAARVALGPDIPPFYSNDDDIANDLSLTSTETIDPLWRMPLWEGYHGANKSAVADLDNAGGVPFAGSITAALFLSNFVTDTTKWLHLDIYGWAPKSRPGRPKGGEAQGIRALLDLFQKRYGI